MSGCGGIIGVGGRDLAAEVEKTVDLKLLSRARVTSLPRPKPKPRLFL